MCPEVAGGLAVPREPARLMGGDGADVLAGQARLCTASGRDVTAEFVLGAQRVGETALAQQVKFAILKSRSPSCGVDAVVEGDRQKKMGSGVLTAWLRRHDIRVMSDEAWKSKIP